MSRIDKDEIQRQLEHQRKLLAVWRGHAEHVEIQIAKSGFDVSSKLIQELREYQDQIKEVEARINDLEIQSVEEDFSLAEAEYRVIAARAWKDGFLDALGGAELQLSRIRLKITIERAEKIEQEVKTIMLKNIFRALSMERIWKFSYKENLDQFKLMYKLIKIDLTEFSNMISKALQIANTNPLPNSFIPDIVINEHLQKLRQNIIISNSIADQDDLDLLRDFIAQLRAELIAVNLFKPES
ncbi:MAG TPA: hypothetical protein VD886_15110 [Herpetosiphonaceae bacterium]|nr:hypothetical protein [Herpetosiphonaceae bacterium]